MNRVTSLNVLFVLRISSIKALSRCRYRKERKQNGFKIDDLQQKELVHCLALYTLSFQSYIKSLEMEIVLSSFCHVLNQPLQLFCFLINSERVTSSVLLKLVRNNESLLVLNSMIMIIIHVSLFLGD